MLQSCAIKSSSDNASYGPYDLWQANGRLVVSGCAYETASGTITQGGSGWAEAVANEVDGVLHDTKLDKAAKVLVNKATQTKTTGEIKYFDNDGETVILTHTPTEDATTLTRMPG